MSSSANQVEKCECEAIASPTQLTAPQEPLCDDIGNVSRIKSTHLATATHVAVIATTTQSTRMFPILGLIFSGDSADTLAQVEMWPTDVGRCAHCGVAV
jgi:hypothetical protein